MPIDAKPIQLPGSDLGDLITQYGLIPVPADWFLSNLVVPVTLVGATTSLPIQTSPTIMTNFASEDAKSSPAAGVLLADTEPLDAGDYLFYVDVSWAQNQALSLVLLQLRNATNTGNIWEQEIISATNSDWENLSRPITWTLLQSERLRVLTGTNMTGRHYASIRWRRLA